MAGAEGAATVQNHGSRRGEDGGVGGEEEDGDQQPPSTTAINGLALMERHARAARARYGCKLSSGKAVCQALKATLRRKVRGSERHHAIVTVDGGARHSNERGQGWGLDICQTHANTCVSV